jgi:hypothetical protein
MTRCRLRSPVSVRARVGVSIRRGVGRALAERLQRFRAGGHRARGQTQDSTGAPSLVFFFDRLLAGCRVSGVGQHDFPVVVLGRSTDSR